MVAGRPVPADSPTASYHWGAQLLLLVVEPQASQARTLVEAFDGHFSLVVAESGADALLAAGDFHPDVVSPPPICPTSAASVS